MFCSKPVLTATREASRRAPVAKASPRVTKKVCEESQERINAYRRQQIEMYNASLVDESTSQQSTSQQSKVDEEVEYATRLLHHAMMCKECPSKVQCPKMRTIIESYASGNTCDSCSPGPRCTNCQDQRTRIERLMQLHDERYREGCARPDCQIPLCKERTAQFGLLELQKVRYVNIKHSVHF